MKHLPVYIPNGGMHDVLNVPISFAQRVTITRLLRNLLNSKQILETMMAVEAREDYEIVCHGLLEIFATDFRRKKNRESVRTLLAANEKNLSSTPSNHEEEEEFDMVQFGIACGLITFIFLFAAAIPETLFY